MIDQKAFKVDRVNPDDDFTFNSMTTSSTQISSTEELIDTFIEDVRNKKKTLVSKMDSVISLMRKVDYEEGAAKQAKVEADRSSLDILVKVDEREQALIKLEETNDMLVKKVCAEKAILAANMDVLQFRMTRMLDDGDRSLGVLDEMNRSLQMRLTSALLKKELALKKKQENVALSQVVLAFEDFWMEKVVEESQSWKQEALEISKLLEFLHDRGNVVDMLHGEISDECQNVNHLKEDLDQAIPLGGILSSNRKLSSLAATNMPSKSSKPDRLEDVVLEADADIPRVVEVITDEGESPRDMRTRKVKKLWKKKSGKIYKGKKK